MPRTSPSPAVKMKEVQRLINLRKALGMSQRELAKEFMVTHASIGMWERGDRTMPGTVLKLLEIYEERVRKVRKP